jgi:methyltransferase-like protein/SAM-dependent methyltransferase
MVESLPSSYDEVPYSNHPFVATHPDSLATAARVFGMRPAPPQGCRVLELGCGRGGNLLPMAQTLPESRFVGIDLSATQVAEARALAEKLGLRNLQVLAGDIRSVAEDLGQFDYVVCHGVYSWVPPAVQDHILTVCQRNLAPNGVAYVSYNTYPGWHVRAIIREMLNFHVRHFTEAATRIRQARALLDLLEHTVADDASAYARLIRDEVELLAPTPDTYLFHEHLEEVNTPLYFYQFAERAAARGLQYLAETRFSSLPRSVPATVRNVLQQLPVTLVEREQYLDFLSGRSFRRTLLCHDNVPLTRTPDPELLTTLQMTGIAAPVAASPDVLSAHVEEFRTRETAVLTTNNPLVKAALMALWEARPTALSFDSLWQRVAARLAAAPEPNPLRGEDAQRQLAAALLQCYLANALELHLYEPPFVLQAGAAPCATPLARHQAASGVPVTNLRHRSVTLDDCDSWVLRYLDGTRDRSALIDVLAELVAKGTLTLQQEEDGQLLQGEAIIRAALAPVLECSLQRLAGNALLLA